MKNRLTFKLLKHNSTHSDYDWMNIDRGCTRVGKVRGRIGDQCVTICSINIFPEFERRGYAAHTVEMIKENFNAVIADRVRPTAVGFWEKMDFRDKHDGSYVWEKNSK